EDQVYHVDVAAPLLGLRSQRAASGGGELVVLGPPVLVGGAPLAVDPPLLLEPLERGVERSLAHPQRLLRELLQALADGPAVHRLQRERLQDQQVESAAHDVVRGGRGAALVWGHGDAAGVEWLSTS